MTQLQDRHSAARAAVLKYKTYIPGDQGGNPNFLGPKEFEAMRRESGLGREQIYSYLRTDEGQNHLNKQHRPGGAGRADDGFNISSEVGGDEFQRIYNRRLFKLQRLTKMTENYQRAEDKIAAQLERPYSVERQEKIAYLEGVNYARSFRLPAIQDNIDFLTNLLPQKDTFEMRAKIDRDPVTGDAKFVSIGYKIVDSPFDDTFTGGDPITFTTMGKSPFKSSRSILTTIKKAEKFGTTEGIFGSSNIARQFNNYDELSASIWDKHPRENQDAKTVFTEIFDTPIEILA